MNSGSQRDQQDQIITREPYEFYSLVSTPSFRGFKEPKDIEKFVLDPYVREIMLANLGKKQVKLAMLYYNIIDDCHRVEELDLTPTGNTFSRKLLSLALISMGTEQSHLKTMLTNYSINETRLEERAYDERREEKKESEKKKWRFLGKKQEE